MLKKKKKKNQNQTNVNVLCKPEEILSRQKIKKNQQKDKSRKKQKVGHWMEKDNFVQLTFPHFLSHFLSILERLNCSGSRKKIAKPHHFSLPLPPLNQTPFPFIFSHIFHLFFSILPKIHPSKDNVTVWTPETRGFDPTQYALPRS